MILTGKQVRLVTLLKKSTTEDAYNQEVATWSADTANTATDGNGQLYVEWWDQGGRETIESGQIVASEDVRAKSYFIEGLNAKDYRIKKDGVEYDIEHLKEIGRAEGWYLMLVGRDNA